MGGIPLSGVLHYMYDTNNCCYCLVAYDTLAKLPGDLFSPRPSPLEGYVFVVNDDRGEDVLSDEICRRCDRKQKKRRCGGRSAQPSDRFVYDSDIYARMYSYALCTRPNIVDEKQKRNNPLSSGLGRDM